VPFANKVWIENKFIKYGLIKNKTASGRSMDIADSEKFVNTEIVAVIDFFLLLPI
jgi:hypothetical protein